MLIESLIRLGRPLVKGGLPYAEVFKQITDITEPNARNFFAHVFVVELGRDELGRLECAALKVQQFGDYGSNGSKKVFMPDMGRAAGVPFVLPKGGNPLQAQGWYGVPVYPIYDKTIKAAMGEQGLSQVEKFLKGRVYKTPVLKLAPDEVRLIAAELHRAIIASGLSGKTKVLGLVVVADTNTGEQFELSSEVPIGSPTLSYIGPSMLRPGMHIVARLERLAPSLWASKVQEGEAGGVKRGKEAWCFFCPNTGHVVSAYCKAWPWFLPTWNCPQPVHWRDKDLVKGIAVCDECYSALYYGSSVFLKLSTPLEPSLTKELFAPVASAGGREAARRSRDDKHIYGSALPLPILDGFLEDQSEREDFVYGITRMLSREKDGKMLDAHLKSISGLEIHLPEELTRDDYRLYITYFSGDIGRGDIHIRASIEDVLPSTARSLIQLAASMEVYAVSTQKDMMGRETSDLQRARTRQMFGSIPFLLGTAYGGPYLWSSLGTVMQRRPLDHKRFIQNCSFRMSELGHNLPKTRNALSDEVLFYLVFREFLIRYHKEICPDSEGGHRMKHWKEIRNLLTISAPMDMKFDDAEELGFACGHLTGLFSRQYWHASKVGREGKDYLKHRVMTFGTDLTPEAIYTRGLARMEEVARRLDIRLSEDFRHRLAVVLCEYAHMKDEVQKNRHEFIAAFWAGHNLAGTISPAKEDEE